MKRTWYLLLAGLLATQFALAGDELERQLTQRLKKILPDSRVTAVRPSPIAGLYEVQLGPDVLYMSEDGRYVFRGDLYDLDSRRNLSREVRNQGRARVFAELGPDDYIEFAPEGERKHTLYVFTDIDCGYCRRFHQQVPQLNRAGIAVRYLAYPRAGIGSESYRKFVSVWCSEDRKKALTLAKAGRTPPPRQCENPVKSDFELGRTMGLHGTPSLFLENGQELGGYIPARDLIDFFEGMKI